VKPTLRILSFGEDYEQQANILSTLQHGKVIRKQPAEGEIETFVHNGELQSYHFDCPSLGTSLLLRLSRAAHYDGVLWVTNAAENALNLPLLQLFHRSKMKLLVLFTKEDDEAEHQVREQATSAGYNGDDLVVLRGDPTQKQTIDALSRALEQVFSLQRDLQQEPFLLPVEDVFSIAGRGTVVTGQVMRGRVVVNDKLSLIGIRRKQTTTIAGIESFRKLHDTATVGMNIGLLLQKTKRDEVERGQLIVHPDTALKVTDTFEAEAFLSLVSQKYEEIPLDRQQLQMNMLSWFGMVTRLQGSLFSKRLLPITFQADRPLAMEEGLRFLLRGDRSWLGVGIVTKLLPCARPM
jgi:elongation factor Tu